jgi:hypothetical protein
MFVVLHGAFLQGHLQALSGRCDVWHRQVCKNLQTGGPHAQLVLTGAPQVEGLSMHWDNPAFSMREKAWNCIWKAGSEGGVAGVLNGMCLASIHPEVLFVAFAAALDP